MVSFRVDYIRADFDMDREYSCELPVRVTLSDRSSNAVFHKWILAGWLGRVCRQHGVYHLACADLSGDIQPFREPASFSFCTRSFQCLRMQGYGNQGFPCIPAGGPVCSRQGIRVYPLTIAFADSSRSDEMITERTFIINGTSFASSGEIPYEHTFSEPGEFEVLLAIENTAGCRDTSFPVIIKAGSMLKPDFTVSPISGLSGDFHPA